MVENRRPTRETLQNNTVSQEHHFKETLIRSAILINGNQVTPSEKLALLGSVCMNLFPEKINKLGLALHIEKNDWDEYLDKVKKDKNLTEIHKKVLAQLEIARLAENLNTVKLVRSREKFKKAQAKRYVLQRLLEFKEEHPNETANLAEIGREAKHSRASISRIYRNLATNHDLPPIKTQARFKK